MTRIIISCSCGTKLVSEGEAGFCPKCETYYSVRFSRDDKAAFISIPKTRPRYKRYLKKEEDFYENLRTYY